MDCGACRGLVGWLGQPIGVLEVRQRASHPRVSPGDSSVEDRRQYHPVFEQPEEEEKQSIHLSEGSVNIAKSLTRI